MHAPKLDVMVKGSNVRRVTVQSLRQHRSKGWIFDEDFLVLAFYLFISIVMQLIQTSGVNLICLHSFTDFSMQMLRVFIVQLLCSTTEYPP